MAVIFGVQLTILIVWTLLDPMTAKLIARNGIDFQVTNLCVTDNNVSLRGNVQ
jgi:hypothetical protein